MMTDPMTVLLDQADSSRMDDDGGVPTRLRTAAVGARPGLAAGSGRLSLAVACGRKSFDGAWWPRSWRLASELPALVAALSDAGETVGRMSVNGDIWTDIPRRFTTPTGPSVRVSWYRTLDPHAVTLSGGYGPRLVLLVIPPQAAHEPAQEVLRMAADGRLVGPAGQILRTAGVTFPPE
jgi:hypothetical protein